MRNRIALLAALALAVFFADALRAQDVRIPMPAPIAPETERSTGSDIQKDFREGKRISPRDYGAGNVNILQIGAEAFVPFNTTWTHDSKGYFFPVSPSSIAHGWATFSLPTGSQIQYIDLYYDDTDPSSSVTATLFELPGSDSSASMNPIVSAVSTGSAGKGYAFSTQIAYNVSANVQYGGGAQLVVQVFLPSSTTIGFKGVDIWWTRQISPAPATATFGDVPTNHPFFRVIEALGASGITSGCGGGNFCPNGVVTRQEMAKFLVRALGLYWFDGVISGPF